MRARVTVYSPLLLAMFMATSAPALAASIEHGKILYEQHCTGCHDTRVHTRPDPPDKLAGGAQETSEALRAQPVLKLAPARYW